MLPVAAFVDRAWLFDRSLVVDAKSGRVACRPSRGPAVLLAAAVASIPGSLVWRCARPAAHLTTAGIGLLLAFGFLAAALLVVPWLPGNRALELDLAAKTVRVGGGSPEPLGRIFHRRFADARGRDRAEVCIERRAGEQLRLLYLANDGVPFALELTGAIAARLRGDAVALAGLRPSLRRLHRQSVASALLLATVGLGLGAFFARVYAFG